MFPKLFFATQLRTKRRRRVAFRLRFWCFGVKKHKNTTGASRKGKDHKTEKDKLKKTKILQFRYLYPHFSTNCVQLIYICIYISLSFCEQIKTARVFHFGNPHKQIAFFHLYIFSTFLQKNIAKGCALWYNNMSCLLNDPLIHR